MSEKKNGAGAIVGLIIAIGTAWFLFGGGVEHQVATDAIQQYEIAKRNGNRMDAYVQAGIVAAAYLQAKDEANYKKWKEIEKKEAAIVGVPSY